jgi:hypothetical protein
MFVEYDWFRFRNPKPKIIIIMKLKLENICKCKEEGESVCEAHSSWKRGQMDLSQTHRFLAQFPFLKQRRTKTRKRTKQRRKGKRRNGNLYTTQTWIQYL